MVQYAKNRTVGGFSVYARSYGEGLMLFTNNEDHDDMIPVWVSRFVANQIRKSVEYSEKHYWKTHVLRFIFLDDIMDFNSPLDAYCPECGRRTICGLKKWDDQYTKFYANCSCGFHLETYPGDYEELMEAFIQSSASIARKEK